MTRHTLAAIPQHAVRVGDAALGGAALAALRAIRVRQRTSRPALCELVFGGLTPEAITSAGLRPGSSVRVEIGTGLVPLFDGEIVAAEERFSGAGALELRVRAYDWLHRLRKRQPVRVHARSDAIELARALLAPDAIAVEAKGPGGPARVRVQFRQTDHDLLEDACAEAGLGFAASERGVVLFASEGHGDPVTLRLGDGVHELTLERSHEPACGEVVALGSDAASARHFKSAANTARARSSPDEETGLATTWTLTGEWVADEEGARALAQAERDRRAGNATAFRALVDGDPLLRPGAVVRVEDVPSYRHVHFVLHQVEHQIDTESGYVCELDSRPVERAPRRWSPVLALAVVVDVADPERRGRVRVRLPAFADIELGWLAVVVPAGGRDKGLCALPDRDDVVTVLFPREDLAHGLVLGGLYGEGPLPQPGASKPHVRGFTLRTGHGHYLHLDDDAERIRLACAAGSFVELSQDGVVLDVAGKLVIRASGDVVLAGSRIDFKRYGQE